MKLSWLCDPAELPSYHFSQTKLSIHPSKHFLALEFTFILLSLLLGLAAAFSPSAQYILFLYAL